MTSAADAIKETLVSPNCSDFNGEAANVVDGLYQVSSAIRFAAKHLGKEEASSPQGAIEYLAGSIQDGTTQIADAINNLADAVRDR